MHSELCIGPFSLAIFAVVSVSNLICTILYPLPVGHRQAVTAEYGEKDTRRESRLKGIMQKEKGRGQEECKRKKSKEAE